MAVVDNDEVEEVGRVVAEIRRWLAVLRDRALLAYVFRRDADERVFGKCGKRVVCLIGQDVAIREEQNARTARRLAREIPSAVKQLSRDVSAHSSSGLG